MIITFTFIQNLDQVKKKYFMRFFLHFQIFKTKLESSRKHLIKSKKLKIKSVAIMLVHKYLDWRNIFVNSFCTLLKYGN